MKDVVGNFDDFELGFVRIGVDSGAESGDDASKPADYDDDVTADCKPVPAGGQPHWNCQHTYAQYINTRSYSYGPTNVQNLLRAQNPVTS